MSPRQVCRAATVPDICVCGSKPTVLNSFLVSLFQNRAARIRVGKGDKPVTYEQAHHPHQIAHRKGWLSQHSSEHDRRCFLTRHNSVYALTLIFMVAAAVEEALAFHACRADSKQAEFTHCPTSPCRPGSCSQPHAIMCHVYLVAS